MKVHPAAALFPLVTQPELDAIAASIRENGQLNPIVLIEYEGEDAILDGRNRWAAIEQLNDDPETTSKVKPKTTRFEKLGLAESVTPERFAIMVNVERRHLTTTQRAFIAAQSEPTYKAIIKDNPEVLQKYKTATKSKPAWVDLAGDDLRVSPRSIQNALAVLLAAENDPKLADQVAKAKAGLGDHEGKVTVDGLRKSLEPRAPAGPKLKAVTERLDDIVKLAEAVSKKPTAKERAVVPAVRQRIARLNLALDIIEGDTE